MMIRRPAGCKAMLLSGRPEKAAPLEVLQAEVPCAPGADAHIYHLTGVIRDQTATYSYCTGLSR